MDHLTTVFIADSSEEFCSGLTAAIQKSGNFQIVGTASDGEQTIRLVSQLKPDILVLDLMLSKQDGLSVLKNLSGMEKCPATLRGSTMATSFSLPPVSRWTTARSVW